MKSFLQLILPFLFISLSAQDIPTPLKESGYTQLTSHTQINEHLAKLEAANNHISVGKFTSSVEGREIKKVTLNIPSNGEKLKVLIFAQQHGNEQSGKEGALLVLEELASGRLNYLLESLDLVIIPQINPDGSEKNSRRNGNGMDLNRNHLVLTEPEVIALHSLFNDYKPHATLDVHEYFPYTDSWYKFGYYKDFDEQFGVVTNPAVSKEIKEIADNLFLPYVEKHLTRKGFSFHNYIVGGPPDLDRIRHSTVDINDGRQSFGIQNTFSVILEGKNGKDVYSENIERRAAGQAEAIKAFLNFCYNNTKMLRETVIKEREKLTNSKAGEKIAVRMEHVAGNAPLQLTLKSVHSGKDTVVTVKNYHPLIKKLIEVEKPEAYLISKNDTELIGIMRRNFVQMEDYNPAEGDIVSRYKIKNVDTIEIEETPVTVPLVEVEKFENIDGLSGFYMIPVSQLKSNFLPLALEPQSQCGLATYENLKLLEVNSYYPILRLERRE
jgi:hypothetical protein